MPCAPAVLGGVGCQLVCHVPLSDSRCRISNSPLGCKASRCDLFLAHGVLGGLCSRSTNPTYFAATRRFSPPCLAVSMMPVAVMRRLPRRWGFATNPCGPGNRDARKSHPRAVLTLHSSTSSPVFEPASVVPLCIADHIVDTIWS